MILPLVVGEKSAYKKESRERERERERKQNDALARIKEGEKTRRENPRVFFFFVFLQVVSATRERAILITVIDSSLLGEKGEVGKQR